MKKSFITSGSSSFKIIGIYHCQSEEFSDNKPVTSSILVSFYITSKSFLVCLTVKVS